MKRKKILGWIEQPSPKHQKKGSGWFGDLDRVYIDNDKNYCVMCRYIVTDMGNVTHACIRNVESTDISWREKQRIKNEIFGEEATAIEVFPAMSKLVDEANMYHIWILWDYKLPFSLK